MAFANPYSYSDLQKDLTEIEKNQRNKNLFFREELCKTIAGTPLHLLTITSPHNEGNKKGVVFIALLRC